MLLADMIGENMIRPTMVDLVAILLASTISTLIGVTYIWFIAVPSHSNSLVSLAVLIMLLPVFPLFWWIRYRLFRNR